MEHAGTHRIPRSVLILAAVISAVMGLAAPVAARESVDPGSLNPPLPGFLNPHCGWAGGGVICAVDRTLTVTDAPTGIFCAGAELLESSDRHVFGQRFYDVDLNLVELRFREQIEGMLFIPNGASVRWTGTDTGVQTLTVPGDRSTGVLTNSGANIHLYPADGRSIALAGRTTENLDTGDFFTVGNNASVDFCELLT